MDLSYWFNVLLRRIWLLLSIPLIAGGISFYFAQTIEDKFKSVAQLSTGITTRDDIPLGDDSFNFRESEIKFNNLLQMMRSDLVVGLVSYKLLLHDLEGDKPFRKRSSDFSAALLSDPEEYNRLVNFLKAKLDSMQVLSNFEDYDRQVIRILKDYGYDHVSIKEVLTIDRIKFTDYVLVSCLTESPTLSAFIVNQLCQEFIRFNALYNLESSDESVKFFGNLVTQKKKELDEKTQALKDFKFSNRVSDYRMESQLQEQQIKQYEDLREAEEAKIRQYRISLDNIESRLAKLQEESGNSETIRQANQRILDLRNRIQQLNQRYIESGSSNQVLMDSLIALRRLYQMENDRVNTLMLNSKPTQESITELENQYNELNLNLQISESALSSLDFRLRTLRAGKSDFTSKEVTIADLQREVDVASAEYVSAQERYNSARNKAMAAGSSVKQVMIGQPAFGPESKHTLLITLFSMISSFAICAFIVLAMEFFDTSIKTPAVLKRLTKLKYAGAINYVSVFEKSSISLHEVFNSKNNDESQAFQHLLRSLRHEFEISGKKTFLFTSTQAGAGKTFVIIALAYALSLMQRKILIVDTNFRNNQLSRILAQLRNQEKLQEGRTSTTLTLLGQWDESTRSSLITPTIYRHIDKIESKPSTKSAAEILLEKDFGALLKEISNYYDYIFMEGAALNDNSDTKELEFYVDMIVPVFSAKSSIKQVDQESIEYLEGLRDKLFGSILNKVDTKDLKL